MEQIEFSTLKTFYFYEKIIFFRPSVTNQDNLLSSKQRKITETRRLHQTFQVYVTINSCVFI